jgi:hypothetical protein
MKTEPESPEVILRDLRETLQHEWVHLQIVGRALSPEEMRRSETLGQAIPLLDEALAILEAH